MTRFAFALAALTSTLSASAELHAQSAMPTLPTGALPTSTAWRLTHKPVSTPVKESEVNPSNASTGVEVGTTTAAVSNTADVPGSLTTLSTGMTKLEGTSTNDGPIVELELLGRVSPSSSFDEGPGSVTTARGGWDARVGWSAGASTSFTVGLHTEASFYGFSGATELVPGSGDAKPLNDVLENRISATLCSASGKNTSWFTTGMVTFASEGDAGLGSSATLGAVAGITYQAHEDFALQVGFAGFSRLEDDPFLFPYFGFDWQITEGLRLATEGASVELSAAVSEAWTLYGNAEYNLREYRLADTSALPSGVMRDHEIDMGVGVRWSPSASVRVDVGAGIAAWREMQFLDSSGTSVSESELATSPYGQLSIHVAF